MGRWEDGLDLGLLGSNIGEELIVYRGYFLAQAVVDKAQPARSLDPYCSTLHGVCESPDDIE